MLRAGDLKRCNRCAKVFRPRGSRPAHLKGFCRITCLRADSKAKRERPGLINYRNFLLSREWRNIRYDAFRKNGRKCQLCGESGKGARLHVDHIKPRSKYPHLALELSNLQVLCEACNVGKSNRDMTDWRPA